MPENYLDASIFFRELNQLANISDSKRIKCMNPQRKNLFAFLKNAKNVFNGRNMPWLHGDFPNAMQILFDNPLFNPLLRLFAIQSIRTRAESDIKLWICLNAFNKRLN